MGQAVLGGHAFDAQVLILDTGNTAWKFGGFQSHGGIPKWMVFNGKSPFFMDEEWGYPHFGKCPNWEMERYPLVNVYNLLWKATISNGEINELNGNFP